ncbi:MAG: pentapeptide repeat-containing protein [Bacteroidia bacterium]|nr:pentapeptide repeat-containing protein [Bacteroidia bacterium]
MKILGPREWETYAPNLQGVIIHQADFRDCDLRKFNFTRAILTEADFSYADLSKADFTGANLTRAIFRKAELEFTSFRQAQLVHTIFSECNLKGADFREANLEGCAWPLSCDAFAGVWHSPENIATFLALMPLLRKIDPALVETLRPWMQQGVPLPDEAELHKYQNPED